MKNATAAIRQTKRKALPGNMSSGVSFCVRRFLVGKKFVRSSLEATNARASKAAIEFYQIKNKEDE